MRLCGRHVSLPLAPSFPLVRQVEHVLVGVMEKRVKGVLFGRAVREAHASAHEPMEQRAMLRREIREQFADRLPRGRATRFDRVSADLRHELSPWRNAGYSRPVQHRVRRDGGVIRHHDVPCEAGHDEIEVEPRQFVRGDFGSGVQQNGQPEAEPIRIEPFVRARRACAPEIQIEDARELRRRGERDEFGAVLQPVRLYDAVQHLRLESRHDRRKIGRIQQADERRLRLRHGDGHLSGGCRKETVLNLTPISATIFMAR